MGKQRRVVTIDGSEPDNSPITADDAYILVSTDQLLARLSDELRTQKRILRRRMRAGAPIEAGPDRAAMLDILTPRSVVCARGEFDLPMAKAAAGGG